MDPQTANLLIASIQRMDRQTLIDSLLALHTRFPMDFSADHLAAWPLDKLRHVLYVASTEAVGGGGKQAIGCRACCPISSTAEPPVSWWYPVLKTSKSFWQGVSGR
jgi:hypothetical protein